MIDRAMQWCLKRPLFYPIVMVANSIYAVFVVFPLWLIGHWICDECNKRFGVNDHKNDLVWATVCDGCKRKAYGEEFPWSEK